MSEEAERTGGVRLTRQHQAQARREQILEAAVRLFAQYGYDGTSTRQIAQEVHITEGLIFHYFPTKADLLAAVLATRGGIHLCAAGNGPNEPTSGGDA